MTVTYERSDVLVVSLIAAMVAAWAAAAAGSFSFLTLITCEALFLAFYLAGSLASGVASLASGLLFDLPLRLIVGYAIVNTALLVLAWISPLGIVTNFGVLFALALGAFSLTTRVKQDRVSWAGVWAVGLCAIATTLWCQDSIDPVEKQQNYVLFKPWVDGFYHAVHIRIFSASHGAASIEDFRMAGVPARLYHYGVYMLPALVKAASGMHSYAAFAGVLAPVGVLMTGLAAYAFCGSLWGGWSGVAACLTLLLLPDGAQQGMQNVFMSYHWLTHISPSATYGLALLAVAWLFVLKGSAEGNRWQVAAGWLLAGVLLAYKVHYAVASGLLLLLVPALFFRAAWGRWKRALLATLALGLYAAAAATGQLVPGVPVMRFDGSSNGEILTLVHSFVQPGALKEYLTEHMGRDFRWTSNLLYGVPYVLFASLGLFVPLLGVLAVVLRRRMPKVYLLFPLLLAANFLAMFFGLTLDFQSSTPDELSHRPLMIVYFFTVTWIGGALGLWAMQSQRLGRYLGPVVVALAVLLMIVPARLGRGVHLMWVMPKVSPLRLPNPVVEVAEYLRTHGGPEDIFQDSQFDRIYAIAALSERRTFVAHTLTIMPFRADQVSTRTVAVNRVMAMTEPKLVVGTMKAYGVRWLVVPRGNRLKWKPELADRPVFQAGPLSVYEF